LTFQKDSKFAKYIAPKGIHSVLNGQQVMKWRKWD